MYYNPKLEKLWEFEQASWPKHLRATRKTLARRITGFKQGIFMLDDVCQVTVAPKKIPPVITSFEQMRDLPVDISSLDLWVLNIATRKTQRGKGYATKLLAYVIKWADNHGYSSIQTAITCPRMNDSRNININPALNALKKAAVSPHKLKVIRLLPNYWLDDKDSEGYGLLIKIIL